MIIERCFADLTIDDEVKIHVDGITILLGP